MKVLVACEFSGRVRDAFRHRGHDAWSCDIFPLDDLPPDISAGEFPQYHYEADWRWLMPDYNSGLSQDWDLLIAHPPRTYLCNSGVRWLYEPDGSIKTSRWAAMREAAGMFRQLLSAPVPRVAVENPVQHRHARNAIGQEWTQTVQPYMFGDGETKRTCLWLKGLPPLVADRETEERAPRVHYASPGPYRAMLRSLTPPGMARAMAEQWG